MDPRTHEQIGDWHPVALPPILFLNTAALLVSCLTMELARRNIFREIDALEEWLDWAARRSIAPFPGWVRRSRSALCFSRAMDGLEAVGGAGFAFNQFSTPASYFFYLITGLHAAHLLIGVAALILCLSA